jgi:hypothetical protein
MNIYDLVTPSVSEEDTYVARLLADPSRFEKEWMLLTPHNRTLFMYGIDKSDLVLCEKLDAVLSRTGGNLRAIFLARQTLTTPPVSTADFLALSFEKLNRSDDTFKIACIYFKNGGRFDTEKRYTRKRTLAHLVCAITNINSVSKLETLSYILEMDPDAANKKDDIGDTPLHYALRPVSLSRDLSNPSFETTARVLLHHRADIRIKNALQKSPLSIATDTGNNTIVHILEGFKRQVYSTMFIEYPPNGKRLPGRDMSRSDAPAAEENRDAGNEQKPCTVAYVHTDDEDDGSDEERFSSPRVSALGGDLHIRFHRMALMNGKIMFFAPFSRKKECYFPSINDPVSVDFNVPLLESGVYVLVDCAYYNTILDIAQTNHIVCVARFSDKKILKKDYYRTAMQMARARDYSFLLRLEYFPRTKSEKTEIKSLLLKKITQDYELPYTFMKPAKNKTFSFSSNSVELFSHKSAFFSDATFKYGTAEGLYIDLSSAALKGFLKKIGNVASKQTTSVVIVSEEEEEEEEDTGVFVPQPEEKKLEDENIGTSDVDDPQVVTTDSGNESDMTYSPANVAYDSMEEYT